MVNYLSASIFALVTFKPFFIFVRLLVLYEGITLMEDRITVAAFLALLNEGMLFT